MQDGRIGGNDMELFQIEEMQLCVAILVDGSMEDPTRPRDAVDLCVGGWPMASTCGSRVASIPLPPTTSFPIPVPRSIATPRIKCHVPWSSPAPLQAPHTSTTIHVCRSL